MTEEQKKEQINFLYRQLDKLGQMIAEDDEWGAARAEYNREYRGVINALRRLEPEKWNCYPAFRQQTTEGRNEMVAKWLSEHRCLNAVVSSNRHAAAHSVLSACNADKKDN